MAGKSLQGQGKFQPAGAFLPAYSGTQVTPTYAGSTDYAGLGGGQGKAGFGATETDAQGRTWRYVDNGDGTGEWKVALSDGSYVSPADVGEGESRLAGTSVAGNGSGQVGSNATRPPTQPSRSQVQQTGLVNDYVNVVGDTSIADDARAQQDFWNSWLGGGAVQADTDRRAALERQKQIDAQAISGLQGNTATVQNNANTATGRVNDAYNTFMGETDPLMERFNARGYGDPVQFDPQGLAAQTQSLNWAQGVQNGSLNYTAAQSSYQGYSAATAAVQYAQAQLAALSQYSSDPADTQRQMEALNKIQDDLDSGGLGQKDAIARIKQELSTGGDRQRAAIDKIIQDIDHGGDDQREVMQKYKALSDPQVTAQERYLAEIARRSFESQDKSNRDAVMQDLSLRGMRSGGAEISNALAGQERLGQDRTLAELGLQANAVQRSQVAMQGWQHSADTIRAAQQSGIAMYNQAESQLRAAQQSGLGMLASEENALRDMQQRGIAMYTDAANQIRAMNDNVGMFNTQQSNQNSMFNAQQQNNVSMFNADAFNQNSQFNANAQNQASAFNANAYNQNSMFNTQQTNNAYANNQQTQLAGGIQAGNMANSIRSMNDAINMFNKEQSQISQRFQDQSYQNESVRLGNQAASRQQGANDATAAIYGPNGYQTAATNSGRQTVMDTFNINTPTNASAGNLGQNNFNNIVAASGSSYPWSAQSVNTAGAAQQGKASGIALKTLAARGGAPPRMS